MSSSTQDRLRSFTTSSLCGALGLAEPGELIAIVGGGGKSALLFRLGAELPGSTILCTTTRLFRNQIGRAARSALYATGDFERAMQAIRDGRTGEALLVLGEVEGEKARGIDRDIPASLLASRGVDFVAVEADGSRMRPTKAPAEHEPVVPPQSTLLVAVAGIDALSCPIEQACHRPERVAGLLELGVRDTLMPRDLARLLCHPAGGAKALPPAARMVLLLNKVESAHERRLARETARHGLREARVERVLIGALQPERAGSTPSARGQWEVWRR